MEGKNKKVARDYLDGKRPVEIEVYSQDYERYVSGSLHKRHFKGATLKEALLKMCDKLLLSLDSEDVKEIEEKEGKELTVKDIINDIEISNGDGQDYIFYIKVMSTGEYLIDGRDILKEVLREMREDC